ncbi:MAG: PEP-utilizing enzyme [Thermodesulfovibrio sp.]|nr:PEP-utilizing enzyme [Thermodesulfovibrio sp.]
MGFFDFFKSKDKKNNREEELKGLLQEKYTYFENLLHMNNHVLSIMADLEEKFSGDYLFDMHYLRTNINDLLEGVLRIIQNLNALTDNKYLELEKIYREIQEKIEKHISSKIEIPTTEITLPLEALSKETVNIAGGKTSNLAELKNILGLPTPEGFAITSYSFIKFLSHNNLIDRISTVVQDINISNIEELETSSKKIQDMIINSEVPEEMIQNIQSAYDDLCKKIRKNCNVSVRSSAIHEDSHFSFAGQYSSFLNVTRDSIIQKYKEVVASLFNPSAIFYYKTKGFSEKDMVMSAGVLAMIKARAGGVIYSQDPNEPESKNIIINSVKGLGKLVVDGAVKPDVFIVNKDSFSIIEKRRGQQSKMLICSTQEGIEEVIIDDADNELSLSDEEIIKLAKIANQIEQHYGRPQDIEWAIDEENNINILQTRPLRIKDKKGLKVLLPTRIKGYNILINQGVTACRGVGYGKVFILQHEDELEHFPEGSVLVAKHTNPKYVVIMNKASAIVTDIGSQTGHMASLSREYNVPTILNTEIATKTLKHEQEITVDATNCVIYEGKVEELLRISKKNDDLFKETTIYKTLEKVIKLVVPLYLVDPAANNFKPENCKTLHDITRFCHEMVMHEMFTMWNKYDSEIHAINLVAGIPIGALVLDIGEGLKERLKRATPEDILSIPLRAVIKGMTSMKWPEPPPVDAKGFVEMIAHSVSIPEEELMEIGKKSFCIVTKNYMNFSIRLGYHFSMIEAYAGENLNDNYIKFFFKGGGAAIDRRLRRVRLISEILKKMGFRVSTKEDVIDAILTKYDMATIEKNLEVLGKLTAYTKQLDMALFNDAVTQMYTDDFINQHLKEF